MLGFKSLKLAAGGILLGASLFAGTSTPAQAQGYYYGDRDDYYWRHHRQEWRERERREEWRERDRREDRRERERREEWREHHRRDRD